MKSIASICLLLIVVANSAAEEKKKDDGFKPLFDGKTLKGWEGNEKFFRVEDKAIVAGTIKAHIPNNEFLCTEKEYEDFELRLAVKLVGKGDNAGIQIRSKRVPNHHEVSGYQADVGGAFGGMVWGGLYDESRRNKMLVQPEQELLKKLVKPREFNAMRIRCEGPSVKVWLNGKLTTDYTEKDDDIPRKGVIGLQIHSGPPAEAWYKDIQIKVLK